MIKHLTRQIDRPVERELWARAAGRCEFDGCNRLLYKSPVTQESVNISEKAHIYSFSKGGPRGRGPLARKQKALNTIGNLLLVCHDCHKKIDKEKDGGRYDAGLLQRWKQEHEKRIAVVTGVDPSKKSYVILYGANIGDENSVIQADQANHALFPQWYPAEEHPIHLDMKWEGRDNDAQYWMTEERNLIQRFDQKVRPLTESGCHFSVFGFAPMPLLIRLGTLFTDKVPMQVYQLHREPEQTWQWNPEPRSTDYKVVEPKTFDHPPALVLSLSSKIAHDRVANVLGTSISVWELSIDEPHNDFLKSRDQLSQFREVARKLLVRISSKHGNATPLSIFPAIPVAAAVELGRVRMPKAETPWTIYDHHNKAGAFVKTLEIGENRHE